MVSDILEKAVQEALKKLSLEVGGVRFEHPTDLVHGDYSTNIALVLAKKEKKNPKELADQIIAHLDVGRLSEVEKVEVAGAGFINFYLKSEFFAESLRDATKKDFGRGESFKGKKIILEYTDPNPFKVFHIGHLMTNTIGESLSRLAEFSGAEVKRVNYQGDVGLHIAKAVWAILHGKVEVKNEEDLGKAYSAGVKNFEENTDVQREVIEINKKIYDRSDKKVNDVYDNGKKLSLDAFEEIYKKVGTKFDHYFFESKVVDTGKEIIEKNANLFQKSDGAIVFKGENYGLHTRVFINSDGLPTYEAKELGLAKVKYDYFPYNESYVITGNDISAYFSVLLEVMKYVYESEGFAEKTKHIGHGMLRLPDGKMSSRTGSVISAEDFLKEIEEKIFYVMEEREVEGKEKIAEMVSIAALKYSILKQGIGKDIIYEVDKSISFEGDSGPYLQYTARRAKSAIEIAKQKGLSTHLAVGPPSGWEVTDLERIIYRFPEIVERAWTEKAPQLVSKFLIDLAGEFNSFYAKEKIAEEGGEYKLLITEGVANILENGLYLLGIKIPDKM